MSIVGQADQKGCLGGVGVGAGVGATICQLTSPTASTSLCDSAMAVSRSRRDLF